MRIQQWHPDTDINFYNTRAWQTDWSLRVECYDEDQDCCDRVRVTSSGVTRNVHPEIMEEYLFYTGR